MFQLYQTQIQVSKSFEFYGIDPRYLNILIMLFQALFKMFGNKANREREREERDREQRERDERIKRLCEEQARLRAIEKEQEARLR